MSETPAQKIKRLESTIAGLKLAIEGWQNTTRNLERRNRELTQHYEDQHAATRALKSTLADALRTHGRESAAHAGNHLGRLNSL